MRSFLSLICLVLLTAGAAKAQPTVNDLVGLAMPSGLASEVIKLNTATGNITPATDGTYDIGSSSAEYQDAYFDGLLTTDEVELQGYFASADGTNLGLIVQSSGNQACNTTCSSTACIIGFDAGSSVFVACDGTTADTCMCAALPRL